MSERSVSERAEFLSTRRARMIPALTVIYFSQQTIYFTAAGGHGSAQTAKISAWLVLSALMLAGLATKGFWFQPREVRELIDDENTRANRRDAMCTGFILAMLGAIGVYVITMFEPLNGREAAHIIMSSGIGAALIRWGYLERRAHRAG
jgi:hypothetical protein